MPGRPVPVRGVRPAAWLLLAGALLGAGRMAVAADDSRVALTIGPESAWVRETRPVELVAGSQEFRLDTLPPAMDPASLLVFDPAGLVGVQSWRPLPAGTAPVPMGVLTNGTLEWNLTGPPAAASRPAAATWQVACTAPRAGTYDLSLIYAVHNVGWQARYQVVVRGDLATESAAASPPLSADLVCLVSISNFSGRAFSNTQIRLVGGMPPPRVAPPGFLMLPDEPLADLWLKPPRPLVLENDYVMPRPATLPDRQATEIEYARANRVPANRFYPADSTVLAFSERGRGGALDELIRFANTAAVGLGRPLPPGLAQVARGGALGYQVRAARLPHTPVTGLIQVNMGPDPAVRARRIRLEREDRGAGVFEDGFAVILQNDLPKAIQVEVLEHPPASLGWEVTHATANYVEDRHRLQFDLAIPAASEQVIKYWLKIRQPSL